MSTKYLAVFFLAATIQGCQSTSSDREGKDIPISRDLPLGDSKGDASAGPIQLGYAERIDWQKFFQKAPAPKEREALLKDIRVADSQEAPAELLKTARKYLAIGQLMKAEAMLKLALRKDEHNAEIILTLAEVSLRKNNAEEAFDYLVATKQEIDALAQKDISLIFRYRYILAVSYLQSKDSGSAHAILTDLISIDKGFTPAYVALSQSYLSQNKPDVAIFIAKRGIDRGADTASLQNVFALGLRQKGELTEAKAHFQKALALDPLYVPAMINQASLLVDLGDKESAELILKRAIGLAPGDFSTYVTLATCQKQLGQMTSARQSYERALELNPTSAQARFNLAQLLHEQLNEKSQALRLFGEVVQLNDAKYTALATAYMDDIKAKGL